MGTFYFRDAGEHTPSRVMAQMGHVRLEDVKHHGGVFQRTLLFISIFKHFFFNATACVTKTKSGKGVFL